jgi:Fe2+ or Zn2+ uptake regulation protein
MTCKKHDWDWYGKCVKCGAWDTGGTRFDPEPEEMPEDEHDPLHVICRHCGKCTECDDDDINAIKI